MKILFRVFYVFFCLCLAVWLSATPASAEVSCMKWNTYSFFSKAGVADVSRCLNAGADVKARNKYGNTPLHYAASGNENPAVITALVKAGAEINARDKWGHTPLHDAAVSTKNPAVIAALIEAGAEVSAKNKSGKTPLQSTMEAKKKIPAIINALKRASERNRGREAERRRQAKSCAKWNTEAFFDHVDAADVSRCLKTKNANARNRQAETPLHKAVVYSKKPAVVTALLKAGAGVNAKDAYGNTSLQEAVRYNENPAVITALLKAGADVKARNKYGTTPLHYAASGNENPAVITALLKAGADVKARNKYGTTPLHYAASGNENPAVITALVKAGAEINARDKWGHTPLHDAAVSTKNPAVITALLATGADPNTRDSLYKLTPLEAAKKRNKLAFVAAFSQQAVTAFREKERKAKAAARKREMEQRLRAARVSCGKWNTTGFFRHAVAADVTRCLKERADPNARNRYDETPLHVAAKFSKMPAAVVALKKAGADLKARDKKGRTPLHSAAVFGKTPAVVTALIEAGADLNARDKRGRTPLEFAQKFSRTPAVVAVLKKASAPGKTRVGRAKRQMERRPGTARVSCEKWNTPAFFRSAQAEDISRCLKKKNPNERNKIGRTPLHYAAQGDTPALVSVLVKAGADPNAQDERGGWTPLHLAAWFGRTPAVVAALLSAGADPLAKDDKGKTPRDYAERNAALKNTDVFSRLKEGRVKAGARPSGAAQVSCEKWNTPVFFRNTSLADIARCLESKKADARNKYGRTPLHYAAQGDTPALVSALVKEGADPNAQDERGGWTPLHLAAQTSKTPAVVTALIKAGADPTARDKKGRTPLEFARKFNKTPAVVSALKKLQVSCEKWNAPAFFKSAGLADLSRCLKMKKTNARDKKGRTPLHLAAWLSKTPDVVDALLAAGADPAARDKAGKTPWDYAEENATLKDTDIYWRLNEERFR